MFHSVVDFAQQMVGQNGWHVLTSDGASTQTLITGTDYASQFISLPNTIMLAICTALVLLMVPGLAFFYAGLVRRKNVTTMLLQTVASMFITTFIWIIFGFSLSFGTTTPGGFIGNISDYALLRNVIFVNGFQGGATLVVNTTLAAGVPFILFFLFQLAFAIITPALVVGAFADRLSWRGYIFFNLMFTIFVYIPAAHWIWGGGFLAQAGVIDWAGGIVIHVTCGAAAIAAVMVIKRRVILKKESTKPHSVPLVAIGGALLFFGWFGFNTGGGTYMPIAGVPGQQLSIAGVNGVFGQTFIQSEVSHYFYTAGVSAFANTAIATVFGMLIFVTLDAFISRKPSVVGAFTGGIAGLATITPTAGYIPIWASMVVASSGALICYGFAKLNHKTHFDDALEVWPIHGIGGVVGAMLVGAFATIAVNPTIGVMNGTVSSAPAFGVFGLTQMGSGYLFGVQVGAIVIVGAWTFVFMAMTFVIIKYLFKGTGLLNAEQQIEGVDEVVTGEEAYAAVYNIEPILVGQGEEVQEPEHHEHSKAETAEQVKALSDKVDRALFANNVPVEVIERKEETH